MDNVEAGTIKLVLAGPVGAGKTTAIRSIADSDPISTEMPLTTGALGDKTTTTVAFDFATIVLDDGTPVMVYGLPGQEHYAFMRLRSRLHAGARARGAAPARTRDPGVHLRRPDPRAGPAPRARAAGVGDPLTTAARASSPAHGLRRAQLSATGDDGALVDDLCILISL